MPADRESEANVLPEIEVKPSLIRAFLGIWSFTWRGQSTGRKLPGVLALILIVPTLTFISLEPRDTFDFQEWVINFYLLLILPLSCLVGCGAMIRDELQNDTISFLLTRPLTRARLFILKYLSQVLWLQILGFTTVALLLLVGFARRIEDVAAFLAVVAVVQSLAIFAFAGLSSLMGLLTVRYLVMGILYGAVVEFGIGQIPTNINTLSVSRHLKTFLAHHPSVAAINDWTTAGTTGSLLIVLAITAITIVASGILFTFREFHPTEQMQK